MRHWTTSTVIAGLRPTGLTAAAVFDGPIDTVTFAADVDQVLIPTLHPGDVVVLDTLAVHYDPAGRTAIEDAGGPVPLPAALQSRLQSDRAGLREAEGVSPPDAASQLQ